MNQKTAIAIHGGAGTIAPHLLTAELEKAYLAGLKIALMAGNSVLKEGGSSTEAVLAAVVELENNPLFNAGKGGVFNHLGQHEMDAAIMEGQFLKAGAVSGVKNIKNPVLLAHAVMTKSPHVMMSGDGAEAFAKSVNIEFADNAYFHTEHRYQQWLDIKDTENYQLDHTAKSENKMGTVGAVALDKDGNIAAATSTGGMTNKKFGRVGDSPIIGAGTYANNETCAISCTGHGELFIRSVVAYDISCLMAYKGLTLKQACEIVVMDKLVKIGGEGGLVAIDAMGNIEMPFNSEGMYRASLGVDGVMNVKIYR
ncbi:MAG: isoaspartyl peptidase/L-asparaginase [Bacteroidota bacterium]|nr:isoaspartyl peptidase/L-asparaginase [Bacteroidota bacterium]